MTTEKRNRVGVLNPPPPPEPASIPLPEGTKEFPILKRIRAVSLTANHTLIVSVPKIIAEMANIKPDTPIKMWYEPNDGGDHPRIILEKLY